MRRQAVRAYVALVFLGAVLGGCSTTVKYPPDPAPPGAVQAPPEAAPAQSAPADSFWEPDNPTQRPDGAFGALKPIQTAIWEVGGKRQTFRIRHVSLEAKLPTVPEKLPVYMTGSYPSTHANPLLRHKGWVYVPDYSLVSYLGAPLTPPSGEDPTARAAALLKQYHLLEADSQEPTLLAGPGDSTWVAFFRHVGGLPVYGDKPACVQMDATGDVPSLMIRRRPLVEVSLYPTVAPQEAWARLQSNQFTKPSISVCQDGGPPLVGEVAEFKVKSVELAYWEPHVDEPRQVMMPYYIFRDEMGHTLYVPAVESALIPHPAGSVQESALTATLRSIACKTVKVLLYAADERVETVAAPSCLANIGDVLRSGHYTLYTEVEGDAATRPQGVTPFGSTLLSFNDHRPNYIQVLPGEPDLILLQQYGSCNGDLLAVLGPSPDGSELVQYRFSTGDGRSLPTQHTKGLTFPGPGRLQTTFYNNVTGKTTTTTWEIRPDDALLVEVETETR